MDDINNTTSNLEEKLFISHSNNSIANNQTNNNNHNNNNNHTSVSLPLTNSLNSINSSGGSIDNTFEFEEEIDSIKNCRTDNLNSCTLDLRTINTTTLINHLNCNNNNNNNGVLNSNSGTSYGIGSSNSNNQSKRRSIGIVNIGSSNISTNVNIKQIIRDSNGGSLNGSYYGYAPQDTTTNDKTTSMDPSEVKEQQQELDQQEDIVEQERKHQLLLISEQDSDDYKLACTLDDLALEMMVYIFRYLSPFDLRLCSQVCKLWNELAMDDTLWEEKCISQWSWMRDIREEKIKFSLNSSWKSFYKYWCVEYLRYAPWYDYNLTREEANEKLQTMAKGTFIIRNSSKPNNLVISYNVHTRKPQHLLLYDLGNHIGVFLNDEMGRIYPTVAGLIKEKKKFLKRPYVLCYHFQDKLNLKRDYILSMMEEYKLKSSKSLDDLCLLHLSCKWGFIDLVEMLLKKGVNINSQNPKNGKSPLHYTLCFIHGEPNTSVRLQILTLLIEKNGANVNIIDNKGRTPLHIALKQHQSDSAKMVDLLLNNNADVTLYQRHDGLYPLHIATKENNLPMVKLLLKHQHIDVNCKIKSTPYSKLMDNFGDTPLHMASHSCMLPIVKELVESKSININALDNKSRTALHRSVFRHQEWISMARFGKPTQTYFSHQIVEQLFKKNANVFLKDCDNQTPLHISIEKGHRQSTLILSKRVVETIQSHLIYDSKPFVGEAGDLFGLQTLLGCIERGRSSQEVLKCRSDLQYTILCGFREINLDTLNNTIEQHFDNIKLLLTNDFQ